MGWALMLELVDLPSGSFLLCDCPPIPADRLPLWVPWASPPGLLTLTRHLLWARPCPPPNCSTNEAVLPPLGTDEKLEKLFAHGHSDWAMIQSPVDSPAPLDHSLCLKQALPSPQDDGLTALPWRKAEWGCSLEGSLKHTDLILAKYYSQHKWNGCCKL